MQCNDCKFIDSKNTLDKCPYCGSDDWVKVKRQQPKKIAERVVENWISGGGATSFPKDYVLLINKIADALKAER